MTPDEINVAISEACGSKFGFAHNVTSGNEEPLFAFPWCDGPCWMPNFHGSLDTCAQFEATLTDEEWENYCDWLLWSEDDFHSNYTSCRRGCSATAPQRCEAFLRVKGKWTE